MSWYVMSTQTGYEDDICILINKVNDIIFTDINYSLLIPKRKIYERRQGVTHQVIRKMFPGYILLETNNILDFYYRMKRLPRISNILRSDDYFHEVKHDDIQQILRMVDKNGLIGISEAFIINDKIQVISGPLYGYMGTIKKIDKRKGRAKVLFKMGHNEHLIDLGIKVLQKHEKSKGNNI